MRCRRSSVGDARGAGRQARYAGGHLRHRPEAERHARSVRPAARRHRRAAHRARASARAGPDRADRARRAAAAAGRHRGRRRHAGQRRDLRLRAWSGCARSTSSAPPTDGISTEMFDAVLATRPASLLDFDARLRALVAFSARPQGASLAAANKRIANILRKSAPSRPRSWQPAACGRAAARAGRARAARVHCGALRAPVRDRDYAARLRARRSICSPACGRQVDAFFDRVLVNDPDRRCAATGWRCWRSCARCSPASPICRACRAEPVAERCPSGSARSCSRRSSCCGRSVYAIFLSIACLCCRSAAASRWRGSGRG